jgi:orotate phosphoribosyltransferase
MENYQSRFIEFMVESKVLTFGDFTTKSGRKTPFFINTGNYTSGEQMCRLGSFYAQAVIDVTGKNVSLLYGPAYKGIPLAVATAMALSSEHNLHVDICFNRKEAKDHGEGGSLVGRKPTSKDRVVIIEDVVTAGTSVRETVPLLKANGDPQITALVVSVDRMEKGTGDKSALADIHDTFGMATCAIVTLDDIVAHLHNRPVNGTVYLDDMLDARIKEYRILYGAR